MPPVPVLTERDRDILDALTCRVRVLSLEQVARAWWPGASRSAAEERLSRLSAAGLVEARRFAARPETELVAPLATWQPGRSTPDFATVSYRAKSRWSEPPVMTACVIATERSGNRFGGRGGRFPRATERTHDLHLAQVYLRMRVLNPSRARTWLREDLVAKSRSEDEETAAAGEKLPDAIVRDGQHDTAIEFAGAYAREKLREFHLYCERTSLAYELW